MVADLNLAKRILDGDRILPANEMPKPLLDQFLDSKGDRWRYQFNSIGYLRVWSNLFGEELIVVRSMRTRVPEAYTHLPVWTLAELVRIDALARDRRFGWSDLRHIQNVKREFLTAEVIA
jgi:hypothetical protein